MKFKRYLSFLFIGIFIIILSSCSIKNIFNNKSNTIKNAMELLTSDKYEGRLPGGNGIKEAEKYIMDSFNDIGLEKYNGSYQFEYKHKLLKTLKKDYQMFISLSNGSSIEFKYGKDFIENSMINADLTCKASFNLEDDNIKNCIAIIENSNDIKKVINRAKAVLFKTENFRVSIPSFFEEGTPIIQITPEVYNLLKEKSSEELSIKFMVETEEEEIPQNNIIGVIKGEKHESAIVISAHFDSVGINAGKIMRGAVDNASGTAVLIDIAKNLKEYSRKQLLKQDVILCAFNGEESACQGSSAFVKNVKAKYKNLYNINIDCVGFKGGGSLMISGEDEQSKKLMNTLNEFILKENFNVKTSSETSGSDHVKFIESGIPAVLVSQEGFNDIIHTQKGEKLSNIDYEYLERTSNTISDFIISKSNMIFSLPKENSYEEYNEDLEIINKERDSLDYNEYKYIKINGKTLVVDADTKLYSKSRNEILKKLLSIYPGFYIPENIGEFIIRDVSVMDISKEYVSNPEIEKVYSKKCIPQNIGYVSLFYEAGKINTADYSELMVKLYAIRKNDSRFTSLKGSEIGFDLVYGIGNKTIAGAEEVTIGNEKYYILYGEGHNKIKGLYRKEVHGEETFYIIITSINSEWKYNTVEGTIKAYKDLKLKEIIDKNITYIIK